MNKKGITVPTDMLVIITVAVLVLVVLSVYFSGLISVSMSDAEAQKVFSEGCFRYCEADTDENYVNAYNLVMHPTEQDKVFFDACEKLGYGTRIGYPGGAAEYPNRCLEFCGKSLCDMDVINTYVRDTDDQILAQLGG